MTLFEEFSDPRLVTLYDWWDPFRSDIDFYVGVAAERPGCAVVDVGCGTGLLACRLAALGHRVTGVDPAPAMLDVARRRDGGAAVQWLEGDARVLGAAQADLALMTGHVAQIIGDDDDWRLTLDAIHRCLRPGGRLVFESRNPAARSWENWTPARSRRRISDAEQRQVDVWFDAVEVRGDRVRCEMRFRFVASGQEVVSHNELRFRSREDVEASLHDAGFEVRHVFGGWARQPVEAGSPELVFVADRG